MKTLKLTIAAAAILAAFGGTYQLASAEQEAMQPMGQGKQNCSPGKHHRMGPGAQLDRMTAALGLTQEQRLKILPILDQRFTEKAAIWKDGNLTRNQRQTKMMALRDAYHGKISALLTPEQRTKADEMRKTAMDRKGQRPCMKPGQPQAHTQH